MPYQIDQSGKVEKTKKLTVICLANGKVKSLLISAVEKRKLLKAIRYFDFPKKVFIFRAFAGLIYLLIRNEPVDYLIIDREYPGHESTISNILISLYQKVGQEPPQITFSQIGKKSPAHKAALDVFQGKRKVDMVVKAKDIFDLFYSGKRKPRF